MQQTALNVMDTTSLLKEAFKLSAEIKSKEPQATTLSEKQAEMTMETIDKAITELMLLDCMYPQIIVTSLFHAWLNLETIMIGTRKKRKVSWNTDSPDSFTIIALEVRSIVANLPTLEKEPEIEALENKLDSLKSLITAEQLEPNLPYTKLEFQVETSNKKIHERTSWLLFQNFAPVIVANVLFRRWLRLATLYNGSSEEFYQKIEYYFNDIIAGIRKYIAILY